MAESISELWRRSFDPRSEDAPEDWEMAYVHWETVEPGDTFSTRYDGLSVTYRCSYCGQPGGH